MGPSPSSEIRLRDRYLEVTADEKEHLSLLKNKLPLTKAKKKHYGLPLTTTLKFHYESADLLLQDYLDYLPRFKNGRKNLLHRMC